MSDRCKADFRPFRAKMEQEDLPELTINTFEQYYNQLSTGQTGLIREDTIQPVDDLLHSDELVEYLEPGQEYLKEAVIIKLNGGLGTSMGMQKAKSLLRVKSDLSFLDIIARQTLRLRKEFGAEIPLLMMNSQLTSSDTLKALEQYPDLKISDVPLQFLQQKVPKICRNTLAPVDFPDNPEMEWNPPGHGDIYNALVISGCLKILLENGKKYAFISNADNLGAELDPAILGYFAEKNFSFMMEAATRTEADKKGGHLARNKDGNLLLREIAQCAEEDLHFFQETNRYRYFNTNSIWVNLVTLNEILIERDYYLDLPLICNAKTVNPRDPHSQEIYQLETAMGAAISKFPGASAINVSRSRFLPVKTTNDLIGLWSDAYDLTENWQVRLNTQREKGVFTQLDSQYYKLINQLEDRFPKGAPSLLNCQRFEVSGDVFFGSNISITGSVKITNRNERAVHIPDNTDIEKDMELS